jgi:hypothetical protein
VVSDEGAQRLGIEQGDVTGKHQHVAVEIGDGVQGDFDGATRARDLVLVDHDDLGRDTGHRIGDEIPFVPDDDENVGGRQVARRVENVPDEGAAPDAVQHLRQRRAHPRTLPRGEDHDGEGRIQPVLCHAPPPGFEPEPHSSKGCRAAVTLRRTAPHETAGVPLQSASPDPG